MAQQEAINSFQSGLVLDSADLVQANTALTNALNATIVTYNGNEGVLQNDMGNAKIVSDKGTAEFPDGYIPVGNIEYGGIMYVCLVDSEGNCQIGSFPSPDYSNKEKHKLQWIYQPLHVGLDDIALETKLFNFKLDKPVQMLAEPSFDGSVNLILTDNENSPKLINTGFHAQDNLTCEIIQRYGINNTNRYDLNNEVNFKLQTSLYRDTSNLSYFEYNGFELGGQLRVGTYVFYAVSCDKDGNETDIICESGVIPVFLGFDKDPFSVNGGLENQVSDKIIKLTIHNVDSAYSYIRLYYTRTTAANDQSAGTLAYRINQTFPIITVNGENVCNVQITGFEETNSVSISDLNVQYFNADKANCAAISQNMLFLANVEEQFSDSKEYDLLRKYSLSIYPEASVDTTSFTLNKDYENEEGSYYNSQFIYTKTGYHEEEFYRFGIVYIRHDGSLTSVFDTLGVNNLSTTTIPPTIPEALDSTNIFINNDFNIKGVCKFSNDLLTKLTDIVSVKFTIPQETANYLKQYYKGYFFVRQKRIPTILAQGYATNVCEESYLPSINISSKLINPDHQEEIRYLYESPVTGAFRYPTVPNKDLDPSSIYPVRSVTKVESAMLIKNNYRSRVFTLTNQTYAYLDKIVATGPVSFAMQEVGIPKKEMFSDPTSETFTYYTIDENGNKITHEDEGLCLYWAIREGKKFNFYYDLKREAIYACAVLTEVKDQNTINRLSKEWRHIEDKDDDDKVGGSDIKTPYFIRWSESQSKWNYTFIHESEHQQYRNQLAYSLFLNPTHESAENVWGFKYYFDEDTQDLYVLIGWIGTNDVSSTGSDGTSTTSTVTEGGSVYKLAHIFGSKHGSWKVGIDDLYKIICEYIDTKEPVNKSIDSEILADPTTPTFNGKYRFTNSINEDNYRVHLYPMEWGAFAIFCPEFELNKPYYNNIFTGQKLKIKSVTDKSLLTGDLKKRHYIYDNLISKNDLITSCNAISVVENTTLLTVQPNLTKFNNGPSNAGAVWPKENLYFSSKAGESTEVSCKFVGYPFISHVQEETTSNSFQLGKCGPSFPFNLARGIYGSYVGVCAYTKNDDKSGIVNDISNKIVNFYIPGYPEDMDSVTIKEYIKVRGEDSSLYYAITDRTSFDTLSLDCYRGDCYINWYTHRVNRNFNDATAPYNDTILDGMSFGKGFKGCFDSEYRTFDLTKDSEAALSFNLGDLNAVQMGSWVTFPIRSTINTALRSDDASFVDEKLQSGHNRTFYPLGTLDAGGSAKVPESDAYNSGYNKSGSERVYVNLNQNVFQKVYYKNRICYSNVLQTSTLTNGNRVFLDTHFRDYTDQFGEITKLIDLQGNLVCVCEHGVFLIPINERVLAGEGQGGYVYINTSNVLPENPKILSDTYGSTWKESVIKTPYGIYGIDQISKKIWYTDGNKFDLISDFKIQDFLNDNLNIDSLEIGTSNLKTHYNKFKNELMFTLYDLNNDNLWNVCFNLGMAGGSGNGWQTFYSWIPLLSDNIGNSFLTTNIFNTKYLWKHGQDNRVPTLEKIKPTHWYGEQHPFEFEFLVGSTTESATGVHKIFDNLQIIANKAKPESFHYEVIGECFNFAEDKQTMYKRQELTKKLYHDILGSNISYDNNVFNLNAEHSIKSSMFPLYYIREDIVNQVYDVYRQLTYPGYDYNALAGCEIVYYPDLNEFRLCNHVKAVDVSQGILRGNMRYLEDLWRIQITPISILYKNEQWHGGKVPIAIATIKTNEQLNSSFDENQLSQAFTDYTADDITYWDISKRQEIKIKDKYAKIKIRYKGDELATIYHVKTLFTISYA